MRCDYVGSLAVGRGMDRLGIFFRIKLALGFHGSTNVVILRSRDSFDPGQTISMKRIRLFTNSFLVQYPGKNRILAAPVGLPVWIKSLVRHDSGRIFFLKLIELSRIRNP